MAKQRIVWVIEWCGTKGSKFVSFPHSAWVDIEKANQELREMRAAHPDQRFRRVRYCPASGDAR